MSGEHEPTRVDEVLEIQRKDLLDQLHQRDAARQRHVMWALLGVSPGALVPLFVSLNQIGTSVLVGSVLLMTGLEAYRAWRAKRDVDEIKKALKSFRQPGESQG